MYAIVEIMGQQFKVEAGQRLYVHHMKEVKPEEEVAFDRVLLIEGDNAVSVGSPLVEGAKVTAQVVTPLVKGEKVLVFHKKRRKGNRKLKGHRQQFTELTIKEIVPKAKATRTSTRQTKRTQPEAQAAQPETQEVGKD